MNLTELKPGASGRVTAAPSPRLREIGLVPGTVVTVISKGLFGNPVEIAFAGNDLLIDRKSAAEVEVCG